MDQSNDDESCAAARIMKRTYSRTINHLPPPSIKDHSPFLSPEFDSSVQEYCRNRNNHISQKLSNDTSQKTPKSSKLNSYDSTYAPFVKISRSCKVVVSGDVAVGKTSLIRRFGHDIYSNNYQTTFVDFDIQKFNILGQPYSLQIWDTAGMEKFKSITSSFYRGCQVALLVFDISNLNTLANVIRWREEVFGVLSRTLEQPLNTDASANNQSESPILFLVGTKNDLPITESARLFVKEQANKLAARLQAELWFVSAQTGENVNELFTRIAALSFNKSIANEIQRMKFEKSTLGACLKEKILQQQRELWHQSSKLIKITRKKDGDDRRSKCVNIQCVIK